LSPEAAVEARPDSSDYAPDHCMTKPEAAAEW